MRLLLALALFATACGHDHDHGAYATMQACFDEHTNVESLPVNEAIIVCCLDHPIDGMSPACGATAAECRTFLSVNLTQGATQAEIDASCDEYIVQLGM